MPAPDITLPDQAAAPWRLADHRDGAVVVLYFRGDW